MSEFGVVDTVLLVQLEADVVETYFDGAADVDADGVELHVDPREVIAVVKETDQ